MATVGQQLLQPEVGWKRIENTNINFVYSTNFTFSVDGASSGGSYHTTVSYPGEKIKFKFTGDKLRIITKLNLQGLSANFIKVFIDDLEAYLLRGKFLLLYDELYQ